MTPSFNLNHQEVGMKRMVFLGILFVMCAGFSSVAFSSASVPGVTDEEVVIGMTCPMSGPAALWVAMYLGNSAWAKHLNDQGGIHGRKIRVVVKDDGYNPSRALANLMEMKNSVLAYGCLIGSATANASKDFLLESKVPVVHIHANPRIWADVPRENLNHLFIAFPDYIDEADAVTVFAVNTVGCKRIALFGQNDDWGKSAKVGIERAMKKVSGKAAFAGEVMFEVTDRALSTHAMKLKESGADGVVIYGTPTHAALILKETAKIGYQPKIFTANPLGDPLMYKIAGELWEGAYPAASGNVAMPDVEPQADRIVEILLKHEPKLEGTKFLGVTGATTMMLIAEALKRAGKDLTRESFIQAMASLNGFKPQGMGGPITFGSKRHGLNSIRMCRAEQGKHVPVTDFMIFDPLY
jgi:branched-chain amino acid transport system substrate-binding protein